MNYTKMLKLMKAFDSLENLYFLSRDKQIFKTILNSNNIFLQENIFSQITSNELKQKTLDISKSFNHNTRIIHCFSEEYPIELKSVINAPLYVLMCGNKELLNKSLKKVFVYNSIIENSYRYDDYIFKFNNCLMNSKDVVLIENINMYKELNTKNGIYILSFNNNLKGIYNLLNVIKTINTKDLKNNLYIFTPTESLEEVISSYSDYVFLLQAKFEDSIYKIVNSSLEMGKEILAVPGNIEDKRYYFSNLVIKEGATVILNTYDLKVTLNL